MKKITTLILLFCFLKINAQTKINTYEYWFDNNYAGKTSTSVTPVVTYNLSSLINASSLSTGLHLFNIRFKDEAGRWSTTKSQYFYKSSGQLNGYEYWFDNNYNQKITGAVTATNNLNFAQNINVNALSVGYHTFNIRFKDVGNSWSVTKSSYFIKVGVAGNPITAYRYWFDAADTAIVNFKAPTALTTFIINDSLSTSQLSIGYHKIHYQFKDTSQLWSSVYTSQFRKVGSARLDTITPNTGGNTGYVTANIYGEGFYEGTDVKLINKADTIIVPDSMMHIKNGNQIVATFNLLGSSLGKYDLVVSAPQLTDSALIIKDGFTILTGTEPLTALDVVGSSTVRANQPTQYSINITNNGNVDALGVPLNIALPMFATPQFIFDIKFPEDTTFLWDTIPLYFKMDTLFKEYYDYKVYSFIVPNIPSNSVKNFNITITNTGNLNYKAVFWQGKNLYYFLPTSQEPVLNYDETQCLLDIAGTLIGSVPLIGCLYGISDYKLRPQFNCTQFGKDCDEINKVRPMELTSAILGCIPGEKLAATIGGAILEQFFKGYDLGSTFNDCYKAAYPYLPTIFPVSTVIAIDPNEKYGPTSLDTLNKYISNTSGLNYVIQFENDSSATAPAQTVKIYDTLDRKVFDLKTFRLGNVTIGDTTVSFRTGVKEDSLDIDLSPFGTFYVARVKAKLMDSSGVAYWEFTTLNPYTLKPATGVLDGFLPPNTISPKGIGEVSYNIKVYDTLKLNILIKNKAYIYFDYNPGVATQTWQNKLDNIKPTSKINLLPTFISDSIFTIKWSGKDTGSGLLNYDIYYKINNGSYQLLLTNTKDTSFSFHGIKDSTYSFYSIARDSALNKEDAPITPDATTTVKIITIIETHVNVKCNSASTGSITLTVTGAKTPVQYKWSNGATTKNIKNLSAGTYSVLVTDALGVTAHDTIVITQPPAITIKKNQKNESSPGAHDGTAKVTPSGGVTPYTYLWNTGATSNMIIGLSAGTYSCTTTDSNKCTKKTNFNITSTGSFAEVVESENEVITLAQEWNASFKPNPGNGLFKVNINNLSSNAALKILNAQGLEVYEKNINAQKAQSFSFEIDLSKLSSGIYLAIVNDGINSKTYKLIIL